MNAGIAARSFVLGFLHMRIDLEVLEVLSHLSCRCGMKVSNGLRECHRVKSSFLLARRRLALEVATEGEVSVKVFEADLNTE